MSGDRMLSEDLTQEVFYKMIKYKSSFNNGKFVPWMFTIARNTLNTHFRRDKENHNCLDNIEDKYLEAEAEKEEDYTRLQLALNKLNTSDKELLLLHRFQKIKYKELAEITGSTPGAIKVKVSRALKKLKEIYLENY